MKTSAINVKVCIKTAEDVKVNNAGYREMLTKFIIAMYTKHIGEESCFQHT